MAYLRNVKTWINKKVNLILNVILKKFDEFSPYLVLASHKKSKATENYWCRTSYIFKMLSKFPEKSRNVMKFIVPLSNHPLYMSYYILIRSR